RCVRRVAFMRARVWLALTLLVCVVDGHAPRGREPRNPDAEAGWSRGIEALKRPSIRGTV
ncbi:hypothetical protein MKK75_30465, partial [Methylobacterium sp. J-030]|uniref:hypothetical protein n=1 Tax=Methylobacterium sp. J-030 TaxID=2836627 RepID=UPI001FB94892